jgi:glucose-1-phosphate thymidylyltransferase
LTEAAKFVKAFEKRMGLETDCLEEIALRMKFSSKEELRINVEAKEAVMISTYPIY